MFGTPSELQTLLNTNLIQGSAVASTDGYEAIHEAVSSYQFRTGVMKKIVLIADQVSRNIIIVGSGCNNNESTQNQ